jgi:hypothetical protein
MVRTINSTSRRHQRSRFSFSKNIIKFSLAMIAILSLHVIIFGTRHAITESMKAEFQSKHTIPTDGIKTIDIVDRSQRNKIKNDHDRQRNNAAVPAITNPRMKNETIHLSEGGDVKVDCRFVPL